MTDDLIYISQREYEAMRRRSPTSRLGWWLCGLAAGFILAVVLGFAGKAAAQDIRVVDGDTIKVDGQSWRLLGYDTPETYFAKCDAEYDAGILAKQELEALIRHAKTVELVDTGRRGRYRRVLGRLLIDGRDVADIMVEQGLARRYNGRGRRKGWCSSD